MTNHVARLYVAVTSLFALFLMWVVVAAHPWPGATTSTVSTVATPAIQQVLPAPTAATAAQPSVRVVAQAPVTTTRTS